jgi:putative oxidoreductase
MTAQNLAAAPQAPVAAGRQRNRAWHIVLWVLQIGLVAQFALAGFSKVAGQQAMLDMFADIGAGQWLRVVTGLLEVAGAVGLLIPLLCGLAGLGLAGVMIGATITNIFILETNTTITIVLFLAAVVVAWGRRDRTAALIAKLRN